MQDRLAAAHDPDLAPFQSALGGIELDMGTRPSVARLEHPAMAYLEPLLDGAYDACFTVAAHELNWSQVYSGGGMEASLAEGMLAAQFAGTYGRHPATDVATGFFLLGPGVHYPLHTHAAAEVYLCISGILELRHGIDGDPFHIAPGDYSVTPSGRVHELTTHDAPVLLAYIWIGDLTAPTWWWEQDEDGTWNRTAWKREPGQPWRAVQTEPLTPDDIRAAQLSADPLQP